MKDYEYKTQMARLAGEKVVYVNRHALEQLLSNPDFWPYTSASRYYQYDNTVGFYDDYTICLAEDDDV